jgi:hypothetical protein
MSCLGAPAFAAAKALLYTIHAAEAVFAAIA